MRLGLLKLRAREEVKKNYIPWLLVAILSIVASYVQSYNSREYGIDAKQFQILWINILQLVLAVPLSRLAIHLSLGYYDNAGESLFSNQRWARNIGAMLLVDLYTLLWTFLFIIPGIIKGYSYSMVPYILAEDSNISITEAIAESEWMMQGYKADLFFLDLSFLLWHIASIFTFGLLSFYSGPYQQAARAQFYLNLSR